MTLLGALEITIPSLIRAIINRPRDNWEDEEQEEAVETVIEATNGTNDKLIYEASDLLYHLIVLLTGKGLRLEDVAAELAKRHNPDWDKARRLAKSKA